MPGNPYEPPTEHHPRKQYQLLFLPALHHRGDGPALPTPIRLAFDPRDPLVVAVTLRPGQETAATCRISRDLLWDGVLKPSGIGDVHVRPTPAGNRLLVRIRATSDTSQASVEMDLPAVEQWLLDTYDTVPYGEELLTLDWEALVANLLDSY